MSKFQIYVLSSKIVTNGECAKLRAAARSPVTRLILVKPASAPPPLPDPAFSAFYGVTKIEGKRGQGETGLTDKSWAFLDWFRGVFLEYFLVGVRLHILVVILMRCRRARRIRQPRASIAGEHCIARTPIVFGWIWVNSGAAYLLLHHHPSSIQFHCKNQHRSTF